MEKSILISLSLLLTLTTFAKKVKFEVDMTDQTISTYGVHVSGDFQALAGYPGGDWQPGTTEMTNESGTQIYSVVVEIPAFAKYEYKFLNGDQWYDVEFVPQESRVGYNFNDNRWIFVDSIANDTTTTLPIIYSGNAPSGLKLLRFRVDLQKESIIDPYGVHVAGTHQGWDPLIHRLYDFDTTIYEFMAYVEQGFYEYKYLNGNAWGKQETVPDECAVNNNRWVNVVNDTVLNVVCFSECAACVITQLSEINPKYEMTIYPNPASSSACIEFNDKSQLHDIRIVDLRGRILWEYRNYQYPKIQIETSYLKKGFYLVKSENENQIQSIAKLVIE
jgi:hypothetical protein